MDPELVFSLLTLVRYFRLVRLLNFIAIGVKYWTFSAEVFNQSRQNGLLQDLFLLFCRLLEAVCAKVRHRWPLLLVFEDVLLHHLLELQAQEMDLLGGLHLEVMVGAKLLN